MTSNEDIKQGAGVAYHAYSKENPQVVDGLLSFQFELVKRSNGGTWLHPTLVSKLPKDASCLDACCGSALYLLDPIAKERFAERVGFDLTDVKFPPESKRDGIKLFAHNVQDELPVEMKEKFDLVTMISVGSELSPEVFKKALKNLHTAVKPGGYIQLIDCDYQLRSTKGIESFEMANAIMKTLSRTHGMYLELATREMEILLLEAGFRDIEKKNLDLNFGKTAEIYGPGFVESTTEFMKNGIPMFYRVLEAAGKVDQLPSKIQNQHDWEAMKKQMEIDLRDVGWEIPLAIAIAKK